MRLILFRAGIYQFSPIFIHYRVSKLCPRKRYLSEGSLLGLLLNSSEGSAGRNGEGCKDWSVRGY